jgi:hypothetical protein
MMEGASKRTWRKKRPKNLDSTAELVHLLQDRNCSPSGQLNFVFKYSIENQATLALLHRFSVDILNIEYSYLNEDR